MTPLTAVLWLAVIASFPQAPPAEPYEPSPPGLPGDALAILDAAPFSHDSPLVSAMLTPDGVLLISAGSAGAALVWKVPPAP